MNPVVGTYDYRLVALSLLVAVATAYTALTFTEHIVPERKGRQFWLFCGACAIGSGIWCMHYAGMLSYRLPLSIHYYLPAVALSFVFAVVASWGMLNLVCRYPMKLWHSLGGSLLMAIGIAAMHSCGMLALRLQATYTYRPFFQLIWLILAIGVTFLSLKVMNRSRETGFTLFVKLGMVLVLGVAVTSVCYAGLAALQFYRTSAQPDLFLSVNLTEMGISAVVIATTIGLGFVVMATNINEKLSVERSRLGEERSLLKALIDTVPDYIYVKDLESRFVFANPGVAQLMGAGTPEALYGKTDHDFYPKPIADNFLRGELTLLHTGKPMQNVEELAVDPEGHELHVLTTKVPLHGASGEMIGIAGISRNITEFKQMEKALREAEQKYRGLFDQANFGIFQSTPDGALLHVNAAMAATFGYASPEEMVAAITDIGNQLFVDKKRAIEFMLTMDRIGGVRSFECEMYCKDGNRIWINLSICAVRDHEAIIRYEGLCDDITERNILREQLLQAQKLEAVGQLAAGIAHEINTPIQYIGDNVQFLQEVFTDLHELLKKYGQLYQEVEALPECMRKVAEIRELNESIDTEYLLQEIPNAISQTKEGVGRVSTLVNAMREFSHPGAKEKILLDLNKAIENTITVARNEWKYVADIETHFDATLPPVNCYPRELNQVILNLVINAAQTIADAVRNQPGTKGKITVRTRKCPGRAEISIEDTGMGIPENIRSRIFDPFFTTKEIGKGTGQGLSIARSIIVNRHDGNIYFETAEGKGTTFIISLPQEDLEAKKGEVA